MWLTKLLDSFGYALEGLKYTVISQRNMRIHFVVSLLVLIICLYLPVSKVEILILFLTITLVLFAELLNTSVEKLIDLVTKEYHPLAKIVKDVTAGAVLLTAGLAVIVGISIFYPYLNKGFLYFFGSPSHPLRSGLAAIIVANFFLTLLIKSWLHHYSKISFEPSMMMSVAFCVGALIVSVIGNLLISLLVYLLIVMLMFSRAHIYKSWFPLFFGAGIGTVVSMIGIQFLAY